MEDLEKSRLDLCEEFATITGSDSAVAQCYLAENDWEMEVSNIKQSLQKPKRKSHSFSFSFRELSTRSSKQTWSLFLMLKTEKRRKTDFPLREKRQILQGRPMMLQKQKRG